MVVPPGWTLAHKGMDLYKSGKFALTDEQEILITLDRPLFGRDRMAKERLRWMFPTDKDKRVGTALRWIKDVEHGLGAFAVCTAIHCLYTFKGTDVQLIASWISTSIVTNVVH